MGEGYNDGCDRLVDDQEVGQGETGDKHIGLNIFILLFLFVILWMMERWKKDNIRISLVL